MDSDLELLERWRAGEQRAGQELFTRHFADIYQFLEHKCGNQADELTQQTFLACLRARDQFRGESSFRTYLFTIARHELYAHLRRVKRDERLDFGVTSLGEIITTPATRLGRAQEIAHLREALAELPLEQQLLLELHYWHEVEPAALAQVFDMPGATVRTKLFRARRALRERMDARLAGMNPADSTMTTDPLMNSLANENDKEGAEGD